MMIDLAAAGVPEEKVDTVIHSVADSFGINVKDNVSRRSVRRVVGEGGQASTLQVATELANADGSHPFFLSHFLFI